MQTGAGPGRPERAGKPRRRKYQPVESTVILPKGNAPEAVPSAFVPPAQAIGTNNSNELRLNFRNAPLEMVLNYLSDAAGFIIVLDTHVNGNVTIVSTHPVSQDEAVDLLNTELNQNSYAAIRDGRTLTIVDKSDAKTRNIPVKTGNNPGSIPEQRRDCDVDHSHPVCGGAATGLGFVVVRFVAGDDCRQ